MAKFFFIQYQNMELLSGSKTPLGGAVVQTVGWMRAFKELGHDVIQGKLENDQRTLLPEYNWVQTESLYHPDKNRKRFCWYTHRLPAIYKTLRESKCDVVYESIPHWTSFYIAIFCKILNIKHIIRVANDNMMDERILLEQSRYNMFFISLGLRFCDTILAQNSYQYSILRKKFPNKKILKVFNPIVINKDLLNAKDKLEGFIAWVANFRHQKNLRLLFDIAVGNAGENFKIAGSPKYPLDDETAEYYSKLKGLSNVEFLGNVARGDILHLLSNAKFLLNTSRYEGFSNTFLEAMSVGTPILSTNHVNPDSIISENGLGFIYENENDLNNILASLSINDYVRVSKNCVTFVTENHDHLVLGKRILNYLGY